MESAIGVGWPLPPSSPQGELYQDLVFAVPRSLSENSICALKLGTMDKVYGQKTLAISPILRIQMLFSDRLLASCSRNYVLGQFVRRSCWPPLSNPFQPSWMVHWPIV